MQTTGVSAHQLAEELLTFMATSMKSGQGEAFRLAEELDLSLTQLKMLFVLDNADRELTSSELAKLIGLSPAATGRAADALTRAGIVSRREDEEDRRVKRLALTEKGSDVLRRMNAARLDGLTRLFEPLAQAQRDALSAALRPLLPHDPA